MPTDVKFNPPFRAEHIGSLLRPKELKSAFTAFSRGKLGQEAYREILERCIVEAIHMQEEVGLSSITDGEFRRASWSFGLIKALEGFAEKESLFVFWDYEGNTIRFDTCFAAGRIRRTRPITISEYEFVRRHTSRTPKTTMPSPSFMHFFRGKNCADRAVYPRLEEFWADLVEIYAAELADLRRAGATYVQIDEVPQAMLCDDKIREQVRSYGEDPDELTSTYIDVVNRIVAARPAGMTIGMHLCRGNLRSKWLAAGSYEKIADRLFNRLTVDGFFLEYDTPRAGDFSPLRLMPKDKFVVLGLVSTKTSVLEDKEMLKRRIEEASRYVPLERLGISPQCGFASTVGGNLVEVEQEKAKLRRVVEVAADVWGTSA